MPVAQLPVLVLVALVFALVVAATARKVHLGLAALVGGCVFGLLRGLGPLEVLGVVLAEILDPDTILLLILVTAIMVLSAAMKNSGALSAFTRAVALVAPSPRASFALTPLLIGTLPMPGGAILSAPLVDALDPERRQGPEGLASVNYWFRHSLELFWPLYPSFILTCALSGLATSRLILLNLYAPFTMIILGQLFVIRGASLPDRPDRPARSWKASLGELQGFLPLAILLGVFLLLDAACRLLIPGSGLSPKAATLVARYLPTLGGVAAASLQVALRGRESRPFRGALSSSILGLAAVIGGIRVFAALLEAGNIAAAGAAELAAWGIPAIAVAIVLPFVSGIVTGVGFAYIGIALPIVLGLFPAGGSFPTEAAIVLVAAFGFSGMMLSPLHVCMVVTAEHFGSGLMPMLRRFALPLALFMAAATAYAFMLAAFLPG